MRENLRQADDFNEFMNDALECSILARFGLAMCFLNEFASRHQIAGDALDAYRQNMWESPMFSDTFGDFTAWYENLTPLADGKLSVEETFGIKSSQAIAPVDFGRFVKAVDLSSGILQMSFYTLADNEGTFDYLKRIAELCRPAELPPTTPFKFSTFSQRHGWGSKLSLKDLRFWRNFSETWYLPLQARYS